MFINIAKTLNIICHGMRKYNYYDQKQYRYVLLRVPYQFSPGSLVTVTNDF
jgi:hypothetical protein